MSADLLKVSKGLKLVYWGLMIVVVGVVISLLGVIAGIAFGGVVAAQGGGGAAPGILIRVVSGVASVVVFAGYVVGLIGRFLCLSTPEKARVAKSRVTLSIVFTVCALVGSLVGNVDNWVSLMPPVLRMINGGFNYLMQIAGIIFFLLFAKALAEFIRQMQLADDADEILKLVYGLLGCYAISLTVTVVSLALGGGPGGGGIAVGACVGGVLGLIALVVAIIALVKAARLLTELSDAVRSHAKKIRRKRQDEEEEEDGEDDEVNEDYSPRRKRKRQDDEPEDDLDDDRGTRRRRRRDDDD